MIVEKFQALSDNLVTTDSSGGYPSDATLMGAENFNYIRGYLGPEGVEDPLAQHHVLLLSPQDITSLNNLYTKVSRFFSRDNKIPAYKMD